MVMKMWLFIKKIGYNYVGDKHQVLVTNLGFSGLAKLIVSVV